MKTVKILMLSTALFSLTFAFSGCKKEEKAAVYACPMKCEGSQTSDKPGKCSVCGMDLKEVK